MRTGNSQIDGNADDVRQVGQYGRVRQIRAETTGIFGPSPFLGRQATPNYAAYILPNTPK